MKRLAIVLTAVVVGLLVVAAPAYATGALRGTLSSGVATQMDPPDGTGGTLDLAVTGSPIVIAPHARVGAVGGCIVIAAPSQPDAGPFPVRVSMGWVKWDAAKWDGHSYTVHGVLSKPNYPPFDCTLVATPGTGELELTILTVGSVWGWKSWVLEGELL